MRPEPYFGRCFTCGQMAATCRVTRRCEAPLPSERGEGFPQPEKPARRSGELAPLLSGEECDACGVWPDPEEPCGCAPLDAPGKRV